MNNMNEKIKEKSGGFRPPIQKDGDEPSKQKTYTPKKKTQNHNKKIKVVRKTAFSIEDTVTDDGVYEAVLFHQSTKPWFLRCYNTNSNNNSNEKKFALTPFVIRKNFLDMDIQERWEPIKTFFEQLPFYDTEGKINSQSFDVEDNKYSIPDKQDIFNRVVSILNTYVDINQDDIDLCALMILMSYEQHKFNWVPYLGIFGDTGSGKSVLTEVMSFLCYRCGYFTQINSANIYQFLKEYEDTIPCLAEDEIQGLHRDTAKVKIYKSGNSKNGKVTRILQTPNGRKMLIFPTFCFKILAGEQIPTVKGLNERTMIINMSKGKPSRNWYDITEEDKDKFGALKWDLLKWRMLNYKSLYLSNKQSTTRIENNLKPLIVIAKGLTIESDFGKWCNDAVQRSQAQKKATREGYFTQAIYTLINQGSFNIEPVLQGQRITRIFIKFDDFWDAFKGITLATKIDFHPEKVQTIEFGEVTKNKLGRILTNIFNSKTVTKSNADNTKSRFRVFDVVTLLRVISNYYDEAETETITCKIQETSKKSNY